MHLLLIGAVQVLQQLPILTCAFHEECVCGIRVHTLQYPAIPAPKVAHILPLKAFGSFLDLTLWRVATALQNLCLVTFLHFFAVGNITTQVSG